ncbi:hypothetical protein [Piscirickettsia salmonis]|uniref:hypothetical protein n=1 Tax=Piscirickettsia salmonis TaxID=1238 RepID=UPI0007C961A9|nr:hypothetical protein A0O36_02312 [Piscirickettsiaceae bacterium NZ-RLO1]
MLHFIRKIGSGRFGKVILVGDSAGGQFAVKLFRQQYVRPGVVRSSAPLEAANFNNFSHHIQYIGQAEVVPLTSILGLAPGEFEQYNLEAMLMPFFDNEREVSCEEIKFYLSRWAKRNFFMGDPRADNFFYTTEFGIIPIDFGLVFEGDSPLFTGDHRSAVINAIFGYPEIFSDSCMGDTAKQYRELSEGRESTLFRESLLFFDSETTVALRLPDSVSELETVREKSESSGPCCAVL